MAETTPGAPQVKPAIKKAASNRLTGALLGQRPKKEQSQVTIKAPPTKF